MAKKILLVDDEPSICEVLGEYLVGKGYEVLTAASCDDAISAYKRERPDVVLLDVCMPGKDGLKTLRELKALDAEVSVIMFSAVYDKDVAKLALSYGAMDYTNKTITPKFLEYALIPKITLFSGDNKSRQTFPNP